MNNKKEGPRDGNQEGQKKNYTFSIVKSEPFVKISDKLKSLPQWVCWGSDGKQKKRPIDPKNGNWAAVDDPSSWGTFKQAINRSRNRVGKVTKGIGFVFSPDDPYFGIDIDNCFNPETGQFSPIAQGIIKSQNSYTEISPSERGVHIIAQGKLPGTGRKNPQLGVEVYDQNRFFIMTGMTLVGFDTIHDRQPELDAFMNKYFNRKSPRNQNTANFSRYVKREETCSDDDIYQEIKSASNDDKFKLLWQGDWKKAEYPSQSEADLALCNFLAGRVGPDTQRIDSLFRKSKLYRRKWDRLDYRNRTIGKAIEDYVEFYHENETSENDIVSPEFPVEVMAGVAGNFTDLYNSYIEVPKAFLYMAFLTCAGNILADRLTLPTELDLQPRFFTILLGESANERKSTAISKTVDFFLENREIFNVCYGVGSAEGLQVSLQETNKLLLCLDEFKHFINKCTIQSSVLLPFVNTLFESNRYEQRTKTGHIKIDGAKLSLLAASTIQTYENTWNSAFTDIGFNNRLFIVPGSAHRRFPIPHKIPDKEKRLIHASLNTVITKSIEIPVLNISEDARGLYDDWYLNLEPSIHSKRLDTYALRLMPILAINELKSEIDTEIIFI